MLLKCFFRSIKQKTDIHHYYEIHITHRDQLIYKRHYNTKLFDLNKILEDLKTYDYNETQFTVNSKNVTKEQYIIHTETVKNYNQDEYIEYLFMKKRLII